MVQKARAEDRCGQYNSSFGILWTGAHIAALPPSCYTLRKVPLPASVSSSVKIEDKYGPRVT